MHTIRVRKGIDLKKKFIIVKLEMVNKRKEGVLMRFGLVVLIVFWTSSLIIAGNITQQKVTYRIDPINEISINAGTNSLVISFDDSKTEGRAKWAITTNENNKRVVGSLDEDLPPGVELYVELETPAGGLSRGSVSLSTDPQDLVTHIGRVAQDDLKLRYKVIAQTDTLRVELQRVLILVLTDGS